MRNNSTILRTTIIRTNTPNHNSIRSWASSRIRASTQDRKLQIWSWARECKALVVFVSVRIGVIAYGLAFGVVGECCGGGVVDVGLAVVGSWILLDGGVIGRKRGGGTVAVRAAWLVWDGLGHDGRGEQESEGEELHFYSFFFWKNK